MKSNLAVWFVIVASFVGGLCASGFVSSLSEPKLGLVGPGVPTEAGAPLAADAR
jgi:hypothetical protein